MGLYKYLREAWKKPKENPFYKQRLIQWRTEPVTLRIKRSTRLDRARSLGYKAKPGFVIVRQRVKRGKRQHAKSSIAGRRPKASSQIKNLDKAYQQIAEERVARKYVNCEVLNSYPVAEDGMHYWFEVIMVDRTNPHILADPTINWISTEKRRVFRGKTSIAKKTRGLRHKGKGTEKLRPSRSAAYRRKARKRS